MTFDCSYVIPSHDEVEIIDTLSGHETIKAFLPDLSILNLLAEDPKIFLRGDTKIVRIGLLDNKSKKLKGFAIRVYESDGIKDLICRI